jgi:hypothetical protein
MPESIGIPYAFGSVVDGTLVRTCPICGEECSEQTDDYTGEAVTDNYGEHYAAIHKES